MTDGTYCAKCRGPVTGYDTYCDGCADASEDTVMSGELTRYGYNGHSTGPYVIPRQEGKYYLASDVDERIKELETKLDAFSEDPRHYYQQCELDKADAEAKLTAHMIQCHGEKQKQ